MGVPRGITLIVGGGYHGKSTLLKALELGVYDHIAGDGREYVITDKTAVKIRAEDGRSVKQGDISLFINHLPNGRHRLLFHRGRQWLHLPGGQRGGGSGGGGRSAPHGRGHQRHQLPGPGRSDAAGHPPGYGAHHPLPGPGAGSCMSGTGCPPSWWRAAPGPGSTRRTASSRWTVTCPGRQPPWPRGRAAAFPAASRPSGAGGGPQLPPLSPALAGVPAGGAGEAEDPGAGRVSLNRETVDLRYVEQLTDSEQLTALGYCLLYAQRNLLDGRRTLRQIVAELEELLDREGAGRPVRGERGPFPPWPGPEPRRSSPALTVPGAEAVTRRI